MTLAPRIDRIEANSKIGNSLAVQQGMTNVVEISEIDASSANGLPVSSAVKQSNGSARKIYNLSNDLGVHMGVERIHTNQIYELPDEIGTGSSSGTYSGNIDQKVWGVVGDKYNQIRLVGSSWIGARDIYGQYLQFSANGDYAEIIFFGTGLNILYVPDSTVKDLKASVDGGSEVSVSNFNVSVILTTYRYYSINCVIPVCSGLTNTWHVVRLRTPSVTNYIYGFEILTETLTTNNHPLRIRPGTIYGNSVVNTLASATTSAYNSFESGSLGTRGGNVLVYLKSDGTVGKAVTPTNSSALFLTNTNHTNEELIRTINWREFGTAKSYDFSENLISASVDRVFTLDDGTTALLGKNIGSQTYGGNDTLVLSNIIGTSYGMITFFGSGIDVTMVGQGSGSWVTFTAYVNGSSVGTFSGTNAIPVRVKIASGLTVGTHVVKILATSAGTQNAGLIDFKIYAPKKPSLPSGAVELGQYYVLADFVPNSTAGMETISTGILRKMSAVRETVHVGTWGFSGSAPLITAIGGWQGWTATASSYFEHTFVGTGFEYRCWSTTANITVTVDGLTPTGVTTSFYGGFNSYSGGTLTANANTQGSGFRLSGLTYGKHTVKLLLNSGQMQTEGFDIITPVYFPKIQTEGTVQNTLPVGSCSIGDLRQIPRLTKTGKVIATAFGSTVTSTTSTSYVPMSEMTVTVYSPGAWFNIDFRGITYHSGIGNSCDIVPYIDGVQGKRSYATATGNSYDFHITNFSVVYLSKGVHKIDMYWKTNTSTLNMEIARYLIVEEQ